MKRGTLWGFGLMALASALLALSAMSLVKDYRSYEMAREAKAKRLAERDALLVQRDAAREAVEKLKTDSLMRERLIRSMGYIKPGEKVYVVASNSTANASP